MGRSKIKIGKRIVLAALAACAVAGAIRGAAAAEEQALKDRVMSEFPKALARMEARFARVRGSGTLTTTYDVGTPKQREVSSSVAFAFDGGAARLVRTLEEQSRIDGAPHEVVFCMNPKYSFSLRRGDDGEPFVLTEFGKDQDLEIDESIRSHAGQFVRAPFGVYGLPMSGIMADPSFAVKRVTEVAGEGETLLKIEYEFNNRDLIFHSGWVLVSPSDGWSIRKSENKLGTKGVKQMASTAAYDPSPSGAPIPRSVTVTTPFLQSRFDFDEIVARATPESEFTLAAFGLPELESPSAERYESHAASWLIASSLMALGVAVALKYGASRLQKSR